MYHRRLSSTLSLATLIALTLTGTWGCSGGDGTGRDPDRLSVGGMGGDGLTPDSGTAGTPGVNPPAGGSGGGSGGGPPVPPGTMDPCRAVGLSCRLGQRCDENGDAPRCLDNSCEDLDCADGLDCRPIGEADGHVCVGGPCSTNADCPAEEYCDGSTCRLDTCTALDRTCDGQTLLSCDEAGGSQAPLLTCRSAGYFDSMCMADAAGQAACACEGDWDCPAFTVCDVGACVGTGFEPTCTLPPVDFAAVPPALELHWGGDSPTATAHDGTAAQNPAPWPNFTHVMNTPVVANLDDDNGDGRIDALDFPEILFMAHQGENAWTNAVVRAIHGGGPNKGADYFSRCGAELWTRTNPSTAPCGASAPTGDSGTPLAVGDLNADGVPEIVVPTESGRFDILNNRGELIYSLPAGAGRRLDGGATVAIANLDQQGYAEVMLGPDVYVLGDDPVTGTLMVTHALAANRSVGKNEIGYMACPADLDVGRSGLEIAVGTTLYALPSSLPACASPPCTGTLDVVWHASDVGPLPGGSGDGYCAVADVWGADRGTAPGPQNPPDSLPEVVVISHGWLLILDGATGALVDARALGGQRGGAPNVDDFDGDGYREIGSALQNYYIVADLQVPEATHCPAWGTTLPRDPAGANANTPRSPGGTDTSGSCTADADCNPGALCGGAGSCVCLHNGWQRASDDDSSRATSSSVFDFNGDGSAEAVYNDECDLRVYRGLDGVVLYRETSRSRTAIENPIVADVDNDGNAEIIFGSNNAIPDRCDEDGAVPTGVNGLRVLGDPTDTWVSARRVWNQQSYHVTNVTESGGISLREAESWKPLNGRLYNTYRSQPRSAGVAPDLIVVGVSVSAAGGGCLSATGEFGDGETMVEISFEVQNIGDLRVGPGVVVSLDGLWPGVDEALASDTQGTPLTTTLSTSLEPSASVVLTVLYDVTHNARGTLPDSIRVTVDAEDTARECREDNNDLVQAAIGNGEVDLKLAIHGVSGCPDAEVQATVTNSGTADVAQTVIVWYAGDPSQGGELLGQTVVTSGIPAGDTVSVVGTLTAFPMRGDIFVYGVVNPEGTVPECSRGNNTASATDPHACSPIVR